MLEKLEDLVKKFDALTERSADPAVLARQDEWRKVVKERSRIEPIVDTFHAYKKAISNSEQAEALRDAESDPDLVEMAADEAKAGREQAAALYEKLKILLLPPDPNDDKNVIMEIRAGAGGDEAGLFGRDLMRMYRMYAESQRWKVEDISVNIGELGGIKEAVFMITGDSVYAKLKFECGVHRVQRVPDTETQGRVHTSTVTVAVLPEAEDIVVEVNDRDLQVDTYRSGGAGGQHVNKTESAIRITHLPTGLVVTCEDERSQIKNRDKAMRVLKSRLYDMYQTQADKEYAERRKGQVGTGDRSERIRTYNFPQGRVTDHRVGFTLYNLPVFMNGDIGELIEGLRLADQTEKLNRPE
ncbi:MAG: peptide chain release factor 1 [Firmicutes bacterium]|nr:peptide chain release factor 1 [Bacillota bacterium]